MASGARAGGGLWPFCAFLFAQFAFAGAFSSYLPLYLEYLRFPVLEIGALVSLLQVLRIVGPNLWGWLADRADSRVALLRGIACAALASLVPLFFARSFAAMFAALVLFNLFLSGMAPIGETLTVQRVGTDFARYGRLRLWGSLGFIASVTAVGAALDLVGVAWLPLVLMGLLVAVAGAIARLDEVPHEHAAHDTAPVGALLRNPQVCVFFAACFLMLLAHGALYAYYSLYLARLGYSKTAIGLLWAAGVLAEVLFFYFQSRVMARFAVGTLLVASFLVAALRFAVIGLLADSLAWLVFAQLLHAVTFGVHHAASLVLLRRWFAGRAAARGQALYISASYSLGGSAGGMLAGWVWERVSPSAAFLAGAAVALAGAAAAHWLRRHAGQSFSVQREGVTA